MRTEQLRHYMLGQLYEHQRNQMQNNQTSKTYKTGIRDFCTYAKSLGYNRIHQIEDRQGLIQDYETYMEGKGYSPSTIHTRLAPVCKAMGIPMDLIQKPKRRISYITRGQKTTMTRTDTNAKIYDFQKAVGIRRSELLRLTGKNIRTDESGYTCVEVIRGKGGKTTLQRIDPRYTDLIKGYFDGTDNRIFTHISKDDNIHGLRADLAKQMYQIYTQMDKEQLKSELWARFKACNRTKDISFEKMMSGNYKLRGEAYKTAIAKGYPTEYDKLSLLAVSVFHLSHWRLGVTVINYMLA